MGLFSSPMASPPPGVEALLRKVCEAVPIRPELQEALKKRVTARITALPLLNRVREALLPGKDRRFCIWMHISSTISSLQTASAPAGIARPLKWAAALALVAFAVRMSPFLFLPPSVAESQVVVLPRQGEVYLLRAGLFQPLTGEITLTQSAMLQTGRGEATLIIHDDAVVRLAPGTTVALHSLSDRPKTPMHDPDLTLHRGRIWVQTVIPERFAPFTIATPEGKVLLAEASVSLLADAAARRTVIDVWDRRAIASIAGQPLTLFAGERAEMDARGFLFTKKIQSSAYEDTWVTENMKRDATHLRTLAQLQHERRAAQAGILPTSPLYPVKRVAEEVDVLLTFGSQAKAQKRLEQANTRLSEAAALLQEGSAEAEAPLQEYRETLLQVATGSGDGITPSLVSQHVAEAAADIAAALPDDRSYALKETVLDTLAALSGSTLTARDVQQTKLLDSIASVRRAVEEGGDLEAAREKYRSLEEHIASTEDLLASLPPEARQETEASLYALAVTLGDEPAEAALPEEETRSPGIAAAREHRPLTSEDVVTVARRIRRHVDAHEDPRDRYREWVRNVAMLKSSPQWSSILRQLRREFQGSDLERYVEVEMRRLREAMEER